MGVLADALPPSSLFALLSQASGSGGGGGGGGEGIPITHTTTTTTTSSYLRPHESEALCKRSLSGQVGRRLRVIVGALANDEVNGGWESVVEATGGRLVAV